MAIKTMNFPCEEKKEQAKWPVFLWIFLVLGFSILHIENKKEREEEKMSFIDAMGDTAEIMLETALSTTEKDALPCIDISDSKRGLYLLTNIISAYSCNYSNNNGHYCIQVNFGDCPLFIPLMDMTSMQTTINSIYKISKMMFAKRRKAALKKYMERIYECTSYDNGCLTAINIYKNMTEEEQNSGVGQKIRKYLSNTSQVILLWNLDVQYPKQLHDFLELDCASYKVLKKIFSARGDSMSVETKSYMLEAIRRAEKRETNEGSENDEFSL